MKTISGVYIRFFKDREVRAVWDDAADKWWFCAFDVVAILSGSANPSNYWYVLKNCMKKGDCEPLTNCKGFELIAKDGKHREMDCFDSYGIVQLAKQFPGNKAMPFLDWCPERVQIIIEGDYNISRRVA